jgi:hypothetical protein
VGLALTTYVAVLASVVFTATRFMSFPGLAGATAQSHPSHTIEVAMFGSVHALVTGSTPEADPGSAGDYVNMALIVAWLALFVFLAMMVFNAAMTAQQPPSSPADQPAGRTPQISKRRRAFTFAGGVVALVLLWKLGYRGER